MSSTFFQVLSDDPQLEKQIGCMTGLLQIFDRQLALRGKRCGRTRISSGASKALPHPPPTVSPNNAALASPNPTGDKPAWKEAADMLVLELGHRESSCSSSLEQLSSTPSGSRRLLRPCSSPRQGEFKEAAAIRDSNKLGGPADLKESLRLLAKLKEAPWTSNREALPSRLLLKDAPRLSYDGARSSCFEFKDALRASQRARDAPRLSVDGRSNAMRPTSNVVARLMGLEELPDPSYPCHHNTRPSFTQEAKTSQDRSRSEEHESKKRDVAAAAAAVGRKPLSSSPRYVMETMPRPPPIQDSSCKALTKRSLVAKTKPGFSQDMEREMMYLRLEECLEQRNILKEIVEVMHLRGLLHWHGAVKLNSRRSSKQTCGRAKPGCQATPMPASPTRGISRQNVRGLYASDSVTKVQSSRAAAKQVKPTAAAAARQKNAQEMSSTKGSHTQVRAHLDAKETRTPSTARENILAKSTTQRNQGEAAESPSPSEEQQQVVEECRGSTHGMVADEHPPSFLLFDDCHPSAADQVEAYVKQILGAAGLLHGAHPFLSLNSSLFLALEKRGSRMQDRKVVVMQRRLIFDCVNHIVARQMHQACKSSWSWRRPGGGQALVQQVVEELQQLPCAASENVGEMLQGIVDRDVAAMSDWSSQACELALHVERLLFKQLVEETIHDMTKLSSISTMNVSARRQLFLP